jgi:RHS repeat-associated protein
VRDVVSGGNGASVASYDYNAYGLPLNVPQSNAVDFGYAGMFYLPEAGLYLTHYRAYNPFIGNWLNRDPIGEEGGINLYSYVGGNPVNFVDPFGLEAHHVFPRQFWEKSQMSSDVKNFFDKRTINTPGRHGWSRAHADYNRRSGDLFDNFCERNNINDPNNINKDQAEQFMDELEADPDIQNFNEAMKNGTKPTPFNFDPITTIITCLIWPEACDGK